MKVDSNMWEMPLVDVIGRISAFQTKGVNRGIRARYVGCVVGGMGDMAIEAKYRVVAGDIECMERYTRLGGVGSTYERRWTLSMEELGLSDIDESILWWLICIDVVSRAPRRYRDLLPSPKQKQNERQVRF